MAIHVYTQSGRQRSQFTYHASRSWRYDDSFCQSRSTAQPPFNCRALSSSSRSVRVPILHTQSRFTVAKSRIPLMETPSWSWYNTFTPLFEPLPNPNPTPVVQKLRSVLSTLTSEDIGWKTTQIHLFGFGQGGTVALELGLSIGNSPLDSSNRRLGSVISICSGLISHPTSELGLQTPVLIFTRLAESSAGGKKLVGPVRRAFKDVKVVKGSGSGESMPRGREEWEGIMKFWGEVLVREESWKGDGEVYEVVR